MGPNKKSRILQRARNAPGGWTRSELDKLYHNFGFIIETDHASHDIAKHPDLPKTMKGTLTRSSGELHPDYVRHAVYLIDQLLSLEKGKRNG